MSNETLLCCPFCGGKARIEQQDKRIAELEQELAQRWEPVNEKFILTYDTGLVDTPKQFVRWNADDESVIVGKDDGSFYHCPLPDNIRLCRLVERAEPQPTIPPDVRETLRETIQRERDSLARHTNERKQYCAIYKRWPDGDDSLVTRWTDKLSRYDAALAWLDAQGGGRNG